MGLFHCFGAYPGDEAGHVGEEMRGVGEDGEGAGVDAAHNF